MAGHAMITPAQVQADVIDIRRGPAPIPAALVADANVLYWQFYQNFRLQQYVGGRQPLPYQTTQYRAFWRRAEQAKTQFHAAAASLAEFARAAEYAELEMVWLSDPARPQPDPAH